MYQSQNLIRRPLGPKYRESASGVWFTSDLHFGHAMLVERGHRPFSSVQEMDDTIIRNWNEVVRKGHRVYIVGDLSFRRPEETVEILHQLNGQKYLILGNHDSIPKSMHAHFQLVDHAHYLRVKTSDGPQYVYLHHYACRVWNNSHHGSLHAYGHDHGSLPDDPNARSGDVGTDCWGFYPVSFEEFAEVQSTKQWKPVDHHGVEDEACTDSGT